MLKEIGYRSCLPLEHLESQPASRGQAGPGGGHAWVSDPCPLPSPNWRRGLQSRRSAVIDAPTAVAAVDGLEHGGRIGPELGLEDGSGNRSSGRRGPRLHDGRCPDGAVVWRPSTVWHPRRIEVDRVHLHSLNGLDDAPVDPESSLADPGGQVVRGVLQRHDFSFSAVVYGTRPLPGGDEHSSFRSEDPVPLTESSAGPHRVDVV